MLYSLIAAFQMYSRIPMPQIPWEERNRRYALCFFPLIGAVIGALLIGWAALCKGLGIPTILFAAIAVCIPVGITGGIHLDGFCDVEDARASFAPPARRLAILSDPHVGTFAVLHLGLYLLVQTAAFASLRSFRGILVCACSFMVSRTLSALCAVTFRCAKKTGTLQSFVRPAHRHITCGVLITLLFAEMLGMLFLSPLPGLVSLCAACVMLRHYHAFANKTFGGITGDTAGWFLQKCELWMLIGIVLTEILQGV